MTGSFVGVDVGGTRVRAARWNGGPELPVLERAIGLPHDYRTFLATLAELVGVDCEAAALGLPGRVAGRVAEWVPNVPYLDGHALAVDLSARIGAPVHLVNDGQAALLGEARFGAARELSQVLLVSIGTGIGGAVMMDRRIVRGVHGTAGAFGWLPVGTCPQERRDGAADLGSSPDHGSWERRASGSALTRAAGALDPPLSAPELLAAARAGRADAAAVLERFVQDLALGLAALASIFDPQRILVAGGVGELVRELLPGVKRALRHAASPSVRDVKLILAEHGPHAGAFGAAVLAQEGEGAFLS